MSVTRLAFVFLVLASVAAPRTQAHAQEAVSPAQRDEARALFERALVAIQESRFGVARDLLRRSLASAPNTGSSFNLAIALRGTGELRAAVTAFEALLAGQHGSLSDAQRAQASALLASTRRELGQLSIDVTGAPVVEIRVDGELVGEAREGQRLDTAIDPGEHVLTASAPHRTPYEQRLVVATSARVEVRAELGATLAGTLVVEAASPDTIVEIAGVARSRGSVSRELPPGEYRVSIARGDHLETRDVRVESGALVRFAFANEESTPVLESPWLWTGLGVAVIGGVLAIVLPLTIVSEAPPVTDPVYPVVMTLSLP